MCNSRESNTTATINAIAQYSVADVVQTEMAYRSLQLYLTIRRAEEELRQLTGEAFETPLGPKISLYRGWMNVYRTGWFHRSGKPAVVDRHAGDLYASKTKAEEQIDPVEGFIATVPVQWTDEPGLKPNADDSIPTPLGTSRALWKANALDWQVAADAAAQIMPAGRCGGQ